MVNYGVQPVAKAVCHSTGFDKQLFTVRFDPQTSLTEVRHECVTLILAVVCTDAACIVD